MRYLLRNVIRERTFEARRRKFASEVSRRPFIGGKPLPPGGTRFLQLSDFTEALLNEIEHHQMVGNVQLLSVGKTGGEVDIQALRSMLGVVLQPTEPKLSELTVPVEVATTVATEVATTIVTEVRVAVPVVTSTPASLLEVSFPKDPVVLELDSLLPPEALEEDLRYTKSLLTPMLKDSLIAICAKLGGNPSGKTKIELVDDILSLQGA